MLWDVVWVGCAGVTFVDVSPPLRSEVNSSISPCSKSNRFSLSRRSSHSTLVWSSVFASSLGNFKASRAFAISSADAWEPPD